MSLEVWFRDDIANALRAIEAAHLAAAQLAPDDAQARAYMAGHADALRAVAIAFGIEAGAAARLSIPRLPAPITR